MENGKFYSRDVRTKYSVFKFFERVPARVVLYLLSCTGFLVSFMLKGSINIAIVAMVKEPKVFNNTNFETRNCYEQHDIVNEELQNNYGGTLDWSPEIQSYILASLHWAYLMSQLLGSWAAQKLGPKLVYGFAQFTTALCSLCIPWASEVHYGLVILIRTIQGVAAGPTWPAMYAMASHWIPTSERSRFVSSFQGYCIGIALTYPLCGALIAYLGWRSVFYTTGSIGVIWSIFWYLLAFDSPETHPRISSAEQQYIKTNIINSPRQLTVPWVKIFTSKAVWAIAITTFGRIWILYTFIIMGPQYMKTILGFSIQKNGLLSGGPFILSYLAALIFCYAADKLFIKKWMSLTNVRKLFAALSQILPAASVILITYLGCNIELILTVWFLAISMQSSAFAGSLANPIDIAPNFSGPVMAFAQTIQMTAGFLSPLTAGYFTKDGHTLAAWRNVFNVSALMSISTYIVYLFFGTAEIQAWNEIDTAINSTDQEIMLENCNPTNNSNLKMVNSTSKTNDQ